MIKEPEPIEEEQEEQPTFAQKHGATMILGAVLILGGIAFAVFGHKPETHHKSTVTMVEIMPPRPPPPPPTPPPTPPPDPPDNPKQQQFQPEDKPEDKPQPKPQQAPPALGIISKVMAQMLLVFLVMEMAFSAEVEAAYQVGLVRW